MTRSPWLWLAIVAVVTVAVLAYTRPTPRPAAHPAQSLDEAYDQYVDATRRANDVLDAVHEPSDVSRLASTLGPQLDAIARGFRLVIARLDQLPHFDGPALQRAHAAHRDALKAQLDRWTAAVGRMKGTVELNSPLFAPLLVDLPYAFAEFPSRAERLAYGRPVQQSPDAPAVTSGRPAAGAPSFAGRADPSSPSRWQAADGGPRPWMPPPPPPTLSARFPADQIVLLHIRNLADRGSEAEPIVNHLMRRLSVGNSEGGTDPDDMNAYTLRVAPVADVAAAAARIDFGTAIADVAARTITVDVNPAKVDAIARPHREPPPVVDVPQDAPTAPDAPVPAALPQVLKPGDTLSVKRGSAWWPATVLVREGRKYRVHYDLQADDNDEWVTRDRMRPRDVK